MSQIIPKCNKCGSLNGTIDITTGKFECSNCGRNDTPKRMDWLEHVEELHQKQIEKLTPKRPPIIDPFRGMDND